MYPTPKAFPHRGSPLPQNDPPRGCQVPVPWSLFWSRKRSSGFGFGVVPGVIRAHYTYSILSWAPDSSKTRLCCPVPCLFEALWVLGAIAVPTLSTVDPSARSAVTSTRYFLAFQLGDKTTGLISQGGLHALSSFTP